MAEAVRFYWLRGDATLPLSAIPEGERTPIRIRRSVAQQHVPEVVKQLVANRFVAATWPSAAFATMILCHPNLAKGAGDGFILDTGSLPWVRLRLQEEDHVQMARLLLAAFGSEAISTGECLAARRRHRRTARLLSQGPRCATAAALQAERVCDGKARSRPGPARNGAGNMTMGMALIVEAHPELMLPAR